MGGITGSAGGFSAEQTAQLNAMLKAVKAPKPTIANLLMALGRAPNRTKAFNLAQDARMTILERKGYEDTVKTSPEYGLVRIGNGKMRMRVTGHGSLGDPSFGTSLSRPMLSGSAAA